MLLDYFIDPRSVIKLVKVNVYTIRYVRNEFQNCVWKHLFSFRYNRLKTFSFDTYWFADIASLYL